VIQSVDTVLYNLIDRGFDYYFGHFVFSLTLFFWPHYGRDGFWSLNRNEYQGFLVGG